MYLKRLFQDSAKELKNLRSLTAIAMLMALQLAINSLDIQVTQNLRISFGFLALAMNGMLFGPVAAMLSGAITDILACILFPKGAYFPGFTLVAMVGGLIYGLFLYHREKITFWRTLVTKGLINLICNVGLNTLNLFMLYGESMLVLWPTRLLKNALAWPLETLLLFVMAMAMQRVWKAMSKR